MKLQLSSADRPALAPSNIYELETRTNAASVEELSIQLSMFYEKVRYIFIMTFFNLNINICSNIFQNMNLERTMNLIRDENVALRSENFRLQVDFIILDASYKQYILVSISHICLKS